MLRFLARELRNADKNSAIQIVKLRTHSKFSTTLFIHEPIPANGDKVSINYTILWSAKKVVYSLDDITLIYVSTFVNVREQNMKHECRQQT